jgi:hypothetical protein
MKNKIHIIVSELFHIALITYLCLLTIETIKEGYISYFFNLNWLLGLILCSGIIMVLTESAPYTYRRKLLHPFVAYVKPDNRGKERNWYFNLMMSLLGGLFVYYKTQALGNISLFISSITTIIILFLTYVMFNEKEKKEL